MHGSNIKLSLGFKGLIISLWPLISPQCRRFYKNIPEYFVPLIPFPCANAGNLKGKTNAWNKMPGRGSKEARRKSNFHTCLSIEGFGEIGKKKKLVKPVM